MLVVAEAASLRDFLKRKAPRKDQGCGVSDAAMENVLLRGYAKLLAEQPSEIDLAHVRPLRRMRKLEIGLQTVLLNVSDRRLNPSVRRLLCYALAIDLRKNAV